MTNKEEIKNGKWEEDIRRLYFNWIKNEDFFRCVLIPRIKEIEKQAILNILDSLKMVEKCTLYKKKGLKEPCKDYPCGHSQKTEERSYGYNQAVREINNKITQIKNKL